MVLQSLKLRYSCKPFSKRDTLTGLPSSFNKSLGDIPSIVTTIGSATFSCEKAFTISISESNPVSGVNSRGLIMSNPSISR